MDAERRLQQQRRSTALLFDESGADGSLLPLHEAVG
jgi:hypothetical protein